MKQLIQYLLRRLRFPNAKCKVSSTISRDSILHGSASFEEDAKLVSGTVGVNFSQSKGSICASLTAGDNCQVWQDAVVVNSTLHHYVSIGSRVVMHNSSIGNHTYLAQEVLAYHVTIGSFCSIGPRVIFGHGDHPTDRISTSPEFYTPSSSTGHSFAKEHSFQEFAPILVGHDVWIGANAYIKHGVSIGNGAIIASGAVVSKNVEAYSIVGGVPARKIKARFAEEVVEELQRLQWWDWGEEKIKKCLPLFKKEKISFEDLQHIR